MRQPPPLGAMSNALTHAGVTIQEAMFLDHRGHATSVAILFAGMVRLCDVPEYADLASARPAVLRTLVAGLAEESRTAWADTDPRNKECWTVCNAQGQGPGPGAELLARVRAEARADNPAVLEMRFSLDSSIRSQHRRPQQPHLCVRLVVEVGLRARLAAY